MMFSLSMTFSNDYKELITDKIDYVKNNKQIIYANIPCTFDIEVSSFYETNEKGINEKRCCMYAFTIGVNGKSFLGRTWEQALEIFNYISNYYSLNSKKRFIFYIQNLAYEFQFFRKKFHWESVFALDERKVAKCLTDIGIEFRCSYILSGYSLANIGERLTKYKVKKKVGDLDYSLLRHSDTILTDEEKDYILYDGLVVMAYIQETIEQDGNILRIPLTKTGYVREYCRKQCLYDSNQEKRKIKFSKYHKMMMSLTIQDVKEYEQLKRGMQGGFTHANVLFSNKTIYNVTSYDETSAYPYVMVSEQFPIGNGELYKLKNKEDFIHCLKYYCCLFDITFHNLQSSTHIEHPLSYSKCWGIVKCTTDNGRVVSLEKGTTTITEQDMLILMNFYTWDNIEIRNFRRYKKGYLPTDFVKAILKLYSDKTTLKDVKGKEVDYMKSKEMVNACYGMCVTDIAREEILYLNDEWGVNENQDIEKLLEKYNKSKKRVLCYQWGIWITAYARKNLFTAIWELKEDYAYSDTDSVKGTNIEKHLKYFVQYNKNCIKKLEKAMSHHNLDMSLIRPKTIKGVEKPLGIWEFDGFYRKFKTLGAKRYLVDKRDEKTGEYNIEMTVSGVNKKNAVPYLLKKYGEEKIFDEFKDDLEIPSLYIDNDVEMSGTGKNTHTYIDEYHEGGFVDYREVYGTYKEDSGVHMEGCDYKMSLSDDYINYLLGIIERDN